MSRSSLAHEADPLPSFGTLMSSARRMGRYSICLFRESDLPWSVTEVNGCFHKSKFNCCPKAADIEVRQKSVSSSIHPGAIAGSPTLKLSDSIVDSWIG
jgi:hypothetical protein